MSTHEVTDCARCPLMYDGTCDHPDLGDAYIDIYDRDDGGYYDSPHPKCPLRVAPLTLRVKETP